jgi:hypothetical protein
MNRQYLASKVFESSSFSKFCRIGLYDYFGFRFKYVDATTLSQIHGELDGRWYILRNLTVHPYGLSLYCTRSHFPPRILRQRRRSNPRVDI